MNHVKLAGLQSCQQLTAALDAEVYLLDLRRACKIIIIRRVRDIMRRVIGINEIWSGDDGRLVEPVAREQLVIRRILQHMLRQNADPGRDIVEEGVERHMSLADKLHGLVVHLLQSLDRCGTLWRRTVIAKSLERRKVKACVGHFRAGELQNGPDHVVCRDWLSIRPGSVVLQLHREGLVILRGDAVCQQIIHCVLVIEGDHGQKHHARRIQVDEGPVHVERIERSKRIGKSDIQNAISLCRRRPGRCSSGSIRRLRSVRFRRLRRRSGARGCGRSGRCAASAGDKSGGHRRNQHG